MLRTWWLHILDGLGHYVISLGEIAQIIMMTNNIKTLGYTYAKHRIKSPLPHFLKNCTHHLNNCMNTLKVILYKCAPREGLIPTV